MRIQVSRLKSFFSSSVGATTRCGLWPVEQYLSIFPIYHQLSPSSHSQHLKISFSFFSPCFPGSSSSSRPFQFQSEDLFGLPILPGDPANLYFVILSILLYFLLYSTLLVLDSSYFSIPHLYI